MSKELEQLSEYVETGKVKDADELCKKLLDDGVSPGDILNDSLVPGMDRVGEKFSKNQIFIPQMLIAAKAMSGAMAHLKPFFQSGEVKRKGTFIIGTVEGDLHDIGKNLVSMAAEGAGWDVIDLGVDVPADKFVSEIKNNPGCVVGLSALLTTTMVSMEKIVKEIKEQVTDIKIFIGGAPISHDFCQQIGANFYSADPQGAVVELGKIAS